MAMNPLNTSKLANPRMTKRYPTAAARGNVSIILTKRKLIDDPLTLEELSNEYNVSRERIRQIEVRAFEKLQKKMCDLAQKEPA